MFSSEVSESGSLGSSVKNKHQDEDDDEEDMESEQHEVKRLKFNNKEEEYDDDEDEDDEDDEQESDTLRELHTSGCSSKEAEAMVQEKDEEEEEEEDNVASSSAGSIEEQGMGVLLSLTHSEVDGTPTATFLSRCYLLWYKWLSGWMLLDIKEDLINTPKRLCYF